MSKKTITPSEYELMEILWQSDEPMGLAQITAHLSEEKWTKNAAAALLLRLADKGFVTYEKSGKLNFYRAAIQRAEYGRGEAKSLLARLYNGSVKNMVAALCNTGDIDKSELDALRRLLNEDTTS